MMSDVNTLKECPPLNRSGHNNDLCKKPTSDRFHLEEMMYPK